MSALITFHWTWNLHSNLCGRQPLPGCLPLSPFSFLRTGWPSAIRPHTHKDGTALGHAFSLANALMLAWPPAAPWHWAFPVGPPQPGRRVMSAPTAHAK
eukprot:3824641-Pyramimonas_sp.AAC.1